MSLNKAHLKLIMLTLGLLSTMAYTPRIFATDIKATDIKATDIKATDTKATYTEIECYELIQNGNLNTFDSWAFGETSYIASIVQENTYEGVGAMRMGIPGGIANRLSHSTAYQQISLPDNIHSIEINYWRQAEGVADGIDYREVLVLAPDFSTVIANVERDFGDGISAWVEFKQDLTAQLSAYAGQTVVLYANVYNNGQGTQMWQYLDDISLNVCVDDLPEPAHIPIPTLEPDIVLEFPIRQQDVTLRLGNGTTALASSQAISIPVELLNVYSDEPIGLIALELIYDWATLRALDCIEQSVSSVDGLICNSDEPGIVRITATSNEGIAENIQLTALSFVSLEQPALEQIDRSALKLTIPLSQNIHGQSLEMKPVSGEIHLQCLRGDVNCDGRLDQADSLAIFQYDVNMQTPEQALNLSTDLPAFFMPACDTDSNRDCNAVDALFISQCTNGISNVFCPEESIDEPLALSVPGAVPSTHITIEQIPSTASQIVTLPVTINIAEDSAQYALGAATIDWRYDPTVLKAIHCSENPNNDFDSVICHFNADESESSEINFTAASNAGVTGLRTMVEVTFEILTEIDPAELQDLFKADVRTLVDQTGQRLPYSIEGVSQELIYLPLIQR